MNKPISITQPLPQISPYTFGTGKISGLLENENDEIKLVREAMDLGIWFHTSSDYGKGGHESGTYGTSPALRLLQMAFKESPSQRPPCIVKVYCADAQKASTHVEHILKATGLDCIHIAQLCCWADYAEDFLNHGPRFQAFLKMKEEGKIANLAVEVFSSFSDNAISVIENDLADACIFYYNLMEREVNYALYSLLQKKQVPIIALRTLGGIYPDLSTNESSEEKADRLQNLCMLARDLKIDNWLDLSMAFIKSIPNVVTTVGATSSIANLNSIQNAALNTPPIPPEAVQSILRLHNECSL